MIKILGIFIGREGYKLQIYNLPKKWHNRLLTLGNFATLLELFIAVLSVVVTLAGVALNFSLLSLILSAIVLFELARPDIDVASEMTLERRIREWSSDGPGRVRIERMQFDSEGDPPVRVRYYDDDGERIPNERVGIREVKNVEIVLASNMLQPAYRPGVHNLEIEFPISIDHITLSEADFEIDFSGDEEK